MTIAEAIALLKKVGREHGEEIAVYFDCPHCQQSYTPNKVVTKAVVIGARLGTQT